MNRSLSFLSARNSLLRRRAAKGVRRKQRQRHGQKKDYRFFSVFNFCPILFRKTILSRRRIRDRRNRRASLQTRQAESRFLCNCLRRIPNRILRKCTFSFSFSSTMSLLFFVRLSSVLYNKKEVFACFLFLITGTSVTPDTSYIKSCFRKKFVSFM